MPSPVELIERVIATLSAAFSDFSDLEVITRTGMRLVRATAISVAVGLGRGATAIAATVLALLILHVLPLLLDYHKAQPLESDDRPR
jgi:hypothetical protein